MRQASFFGLPPPSVVQPSASAAADYSPTKAGYAPSVRCRAPPIAGEPEPPDEAVSTSPAPKVKRRVAMTRAEYAERQYQSYLARWKRPAYRRGMVHGAFVGVFATYLGFRLRVGGRPLFNPKQLGAVTLFALTLWLSAPLEK